MKCRLHDITSNNAIGFGAIICVKPTVKNMYYYAYRVARKAYKRNKEVNLLISSYGGKLIMTISSIPELGLLIIGNRHSTWVKEEI